jgi:hypothetical protein
MSNGKVSAQYHQANYFEFGKCTISPSKLLRIWNNLYIARTKWWKLRGEEAQTFKERMLGEGPWEEGADVDDMWLKMATCVRKVASEVFGVSREASRK